MISNDYALFLLMQENGYLDLGSWLLDCLHVCDSYLSLNLLYLQFQGKTISEIFYLNLTHVYNKYEDDPSAN